jgi:hypothetical protein
VKLYPIRFGANDAKFYLVADDVVEFERIPAVRHFADAVCDILGLGGDDRRFVRVNYESDGIFVAKLFGPAVDRLGETAEMLPGQIGNNFRARGIDGLFALKAMAAILEKPLVEAMLGRNVVTDNG